MLTLNELTCVNIENKLVNVRTRITKRLVSKPADNEYAAVFFIITVISKSLNRITAYVKKIKNSKTAKFPNG
jgi:hypothetical protein